MKQGKAWGTTEAVFAHPTVSVHRIAIEPGGYCSKHLHQRRWNHFFVEDGEVQITQWSDTGCEDVTTLRHGESISVAPEVQHKFYSQGGAVVYETYHAEIDADDIIRFDEGGCR